MPDAERAPWPKGIGANTLIVDDLPTTKRFYGAVFGLSVVFEDAESAVFRFGTTQINLLVSTAAGELIDPGVVAAQLRIAVAIRLTNRLVVGWNV
ncbi:MAG: hypothetical protein ACRDF7_07535 [Candidatus Limnocylindrales bacterium]